MSEKFSGKVRFHCFSEELEPKMFWKMLLIWMKVDAKCCNSNTIKSGDMVGSADCEMVCSGLIMQLNYLHFMVVYVGFMI